MNASASSRGRTGPGRPPTISGQQLLDAGRMVVTEHGYRGASIAAIAERAGVSTGAMYRYFPSKVDLFVEVFRDVCEREMRAATRAARTVPAPLDKLEAMLEVFATRALSNPVLGWALLAEPVDPAVEAVRLTYRRTYRDAVQRLLDRAVEAGTIAPQDTAIAAAALLGGAGEVLAGPLSPVPDLPVDPRTVTEALLRLARGAIGAPTPATAPPQP